MDFSQLPTFRLDGKIALVTGGSKGIGLAMAGALASQGAEVIISGRNITDLEQAVGLMTSQDLSVSYIQSDVTDKKQVDDMINQIVEKHGSLDILINNAGMNIRKPLLEVEEKDWDQVIDTNLKGIFFVGQAASRQMISQKSGRIINISSILGGIGMPFQTSYAASKGGINQMTKVWASELSPHQITVNAIAPAYIKTPMTEPWLDDEERYKTIVSNTMTNRIGELEDLAGPAVFLSSDASSYVTGQILYVDGGWTAK
ncbi:2-deoxy-D-gluconate 3-dehydrogenase [Bacillus ectoiniformans]|uniref:SDR family NAD(P)-dependent oxidoreductase n=1 Tax=Bacillus ectoiniformans TaxID=1494429 RepID=UPI00195D8A5F|nr:glucose 1-dehydrogenase [Bacillus ectoiniformans]MBM7648699.1 2-deoxy-D-gluconate 3-dehydrogenase [Bacillus ectoiniformans]